MTKEIMQSAIMLLNFCMLFISITISVTACYYHSNSGDVGKEGLGGVDFIKKDISVDSFILEVKLVPYLGESTASLVNRARDSADSYAKTECSKMYCKTAAQISGQQGSEAFAARTWTFIYKCYDCSK